MDDEYLEESGFALTDVFWCHLLGTARTLKSVMVVDNAAQIQCRDS
jgi:hypothetical protein